MNLTRLRRRTRGTQLTANRRWITLRHSSRTCGLTYMHPPIIFEQTARTTTIVHYNEIQKIYHVSHGEQKTVTQKRHENWAKCSPRVQPGVSQLDLLRQSHLEQPCLLNPLYTHHSLCEEGNEG